MRDMWVSVLKDAGAGARACARVDREGVIEGRTESAESDPTPPSLTHQPNRAQHFLVVCIMRVHHTDQTRSVGFGSDVVSQMSTWTKVRVKM